jgi:predicted metal-binding membrane protein
VNAATRETLPGWIALLVVAALAWRRTLADAAMMGDAPGTMGMPLVPFLVMWVPMMAAMMLPAITPAGTLWLRFIARSESGISRLARLAAFAGGYLAVWSAAGVGAFVLMRPIEQMLDAGLVSGRTVAAVVFALAGIYQLSPLREACLARCTSPTALLGLATSRPGALRDLHAGALHGAWCLACCWALMAVLALVGLMNVAAMAALAAFIFVEKTTRYGVAAGRLAGVLMLVAAGVVLAAGK